MLTLSGRASVAHYQAALRSVTYRDSDGVSPKTGKRVIKLSGAMTASGEFCLRPTEPGDAELLYRIYASTREEELSIVPWDASAKEAFLRMQFAAQDTYYRATYPHASYDLVVSGHDVLGRLYVDRGEPAWRVLDVALLPEHRGNGIGTRLLTNVIAEAATAGKPVQVHVERLNPARHLYDRLGFREIDDQGIYLLLEREPGYPNTAS